MNAWGWAWVTCLGVMACVEIAAILNKARGDTLSENVWRWFAATDARRAGWRGFRRTCLLLGMVWLTLHFVTGGRF